MGLPACHRVACVDEAFGAVPGANHEVEGSVLCWRSDGERTERLGERVKSFYVYTMGHSLAAHAGWVREGRPELVQTLADATGWLEARDKRLVISLNHGWLSDGLAAAGRRDDARCHAARALACWRRIGALPRRAARRTSTR